MTKSDYYLALSNEGFHKIAYSEWGMPTHPNIPVICVHGLSRNRHDFDELAEYLAKQNHHVFCPDVVGRGDSDWFKDPKFYTIEQFLLDLNVCIARTGAKQVDWIGTSMGGGLGLILAALPNSPIRKLILNDIGPQMPMRPFKRLDKLTKETPHFPSLLAAKEYYKKIYTEFGSMTEEQWDKFTKNNLREIAGKFVSKTDPNIRTRPPVTFIIKAISKHPMKALLGRIEVDIWHLWKKVKCPVLIIHGEKSDVLLPKVVTKMQEIHPATEVVTVKGAGHTPHLLDLYHHKLIADWLNKKI